MPVPSVVNVGAVAASASAVAPGVPAGVLAGDILLLFIETAAQAVSVSGGTETWTEVSGSPSTQGGTRLTVFWARASQDSPTGPLTSDSGDHQLARMIAVRGVKTSGDPWSDAPVASQEAASDTSVSIAGVTTTKADCLIVYALAGDLPDGNGTTEFSGEANASLANVAEQVDNRTNAGNGGSLGVWTGEKSTAGATGALTCTKASAAVKAMICIPLEGEVSAATGTLNSTFPSPSAAITGSVTIGGVLGASLPSATASLSGASTVAGAVGATIPGAVGAFGGSALVAGGLGATVPSPAAALTGSVSDPGVSGEFSSVLPSPTTALEADALATGQLGSTVPSPSAGLQASAASSGALESTVPSPSAAFDAGVALAGEIGAAAPTITAGLSGATIVKSTLGATLPTPIASLEGAGAGAALASLDAVLPSILASIDGQTGLAGQISASFPLPAASMAGLVTGNPGPPPQARGRFYRRFILNPSRRDI